ncbi:MAG: radical SAM protein [Planctomycetota bacterium]|nr:radical SAM protein [Planctomycetota bacterium]MDP6940749.1 radical SAM protein [Planctomycetota bacterium]
MKTLLLFPPQGHFTQPYLALPSLQAYLKQEGFEDTHLMDANIESYEWFLSRDRLMESKKRLQSKGRWEDLEAKSTLNYSQMLEYRSLSQAELSGDWVIENIEESKEVMRDAGRFYNRDSYTRSARCIEQALNLISAEHYPSHWSAHGFSMQHSIQSTDQILAGAVDESGNPFLEFFREVTLPKIKKLNPDLLGISLTYGSQAIPAFALARMLKEWKPELHITCGGGLLAYIGKNLANRSEVFDWVDSFVLLEGEQPLLAIAKALRDGKSLDGIPNIIHRDTNDLVIVEREASSVSIDTLPTPDFEGLPMELYFSPEFIVPLSITRGCYWGKCTFCTLHDVIGPGYRGRSIEKVITDIKSLQEKYDSKRFYFPIEDLPPNMVRKLPRAILDAGLDIDWWCDAKLEPEVFTPEVCKELRDSGCKRLAFGYESASGRVLDLMCKGSQPESAMEVIRRVHDAGISVTLYVMVGFPTETEEEAQMTLDTLLENQNYFEEASMRVFYLDYKSEIFKRREDFNIDEVFLEEGMDLQVYHDFRTTTGMSRIQSRKKYLQMLAAMKSHLPVFASRNLLYHELKSHYFLYLSRAGSVKKLLEGPFSECQVPPLQSSARLSMSPALHFMDTNYDRDEVDQAIESATDDITLPRYQFDSIAGKELIELQESTEVVHPSYSVLVLNECTGEIATISPDGAQLLQSLDGAKTLNQVLNNFDSSTREIVFNFLNHLLQSGLIEQSSPIGIAA